jgi:DNA-binding transcriptional LysR family regulator
VSSNRRRSPIGLEFHELRERRVDLVLTGIYLFEDDIEIEHLFDEPNYVVAGLSSPWASRRKIDLVELVKEAWIFPPNPVIVKMITDAFQARGLETPAERVSASSIPLRNYLLATGRFLTVLTNSVLHYNAKQWSTESIARLAYHAALHRNSDAEKSYLEPGGSAFHRTFARSR